MTTITTHYTSTQPIVELDRVSFSYLGSDREVLQNVSLTIDSGDFVLVLGSSGSGKSTFAMLLNGLIPHSIPGQLDGTVKIDGLLTMKTPVHELATRVGMVFQDPDAQIVNVLVQDEINFGMENLRWDENVIKMKAKQAMSQLGIEHLVGRNVMSLSGGQKQKVVLASVLALEPKILVLDEPTANLDPLGTKEVFDVIGHLNHEHNITVVLIENRVDELVDLVNRVVLLENGTISLNGPPGEVYRKLRGRTGLWLPQVTEMAMRYSSETLQLPMTVQEGCDFLVNGINHLQWQLKPEIDQQASILKTSESLLDVKNLQFQYHIKLPLVLKKISFKIESGGIVAIVGQNGSGKTTLARLLVRILNPPVGTVFLNTQDIRHLSVKDVSSQIGYVFQNPDHQFVSDTVYDELAYSLRIHGFSEAEVEEKTREMILRMDLQGKEQTSPFSLSVGERRRLSVGTMLILNQKLVILDEPTIGLDPSHSHALMALLAQLAKEFGHTMLLITHDMRLVADWTSHTIVLNQGEILFDGETREVFQDSMLLREAHLTEPPIAKVVHRLRYIVPDFPHDIVSLAQLERIMPLNVQSMYERRTDYGS